MSTISVPLTPKLEQTIETLVKVGHGANKADLIRKAIAKYAEDQAVMAVLQAEQEVREGKALKGDLRKLLRQTKV